MPSPAIPIRLGPFNLGINTYSDPANVNDLELVDCVNFDVDFDGSLVSRPPVVKVTISTNPFVNKRPLILGFALFAGVSYMIASCDNPVGVWYSIDGGKNWIQITATISARCFVQYGPAVDTIWIVSDGTNANPGGSWSPTAGFTAAPNMPTGQAAIVHRERMFICKGSGATGPTASTLYWSKATDPTVWATGAAGGGTANVNLGDGQVIVDIIVANDNILIFKNDSTYDLAFTTDPGLGTVRRISNVIGASTYRCVAAFENVVFVYHAGFVYEVINRHFTRINFKVPFLYDAGVPSPFTESVFICLLGDRLVVRYYKRLYVYSLKSKVWTRWQSNILFGPLVVQPTIIANTVPTKYYAGGATQGDRAVYNINDGFDSVNKENITCSLTTKTYDLSVRRSKSRYIIPVEHRYKRLFWWGADIEAVNSVVGIVTPSSIGTSSVWSDFKMMTWGFYQAQKWSTYSGSGTSVTTTVSPTGSAVGASTVTTVTWTAVGAFTWSQIAANTWAYPLGGAPVAVPKTINARRFIKLLKGIRFRQVNFQLIFTTNGTIQQSPVRFFNILTMIGMKETVVQSSN